MDPYDARTWPTPWQLAPGVLGVACRRDVFILSAVLAVQPGLGDVGRYLDTLPTDMEVHVPNVTSPTLATMLHRRGFRERRIELLNGEPVDVFVRKALAL